MIFIQQSLKIKETVKCSTSRRPGADLDAAGNPSDNLRCLQIFVTAGVNAAHPHRGLFNASPLWGTPGSVSVGGLFARAVGHPARSGDVAACRGRQAGQGKDCL